MTQLYPSTFVFPGTTLYPGWQPGPGALLGRGRRAAERLMVDTCTVVRVTAATTDPDTGVIAPPTYSTIYSGACKIQQTAPATGSTVAGQADVLIGQLQLHLPVTTTTGNVAPNDLVTITACAFDPSLVGKTFALRGPAHKSYATARRLPMIEVTS